MDAMTTKEEKEELYLILKKCMQLLGMRHLTETRARSAWAYARTHGDGQATPHGGGHTTHSGHESSGHAGH